MARARDGERVVVADTQLLRQVEDAQRRERRLRERLDDALRSEASLVRRIETYQRQLDRLLGIPERQDDRQRPDWVIGDEQDRVDADAAEAKALRRYRRKANPEQ